MPARQNGKGANEGRRARGSLEWRSRRARAYAAFGGLSACFAGAVLLALWPLYRDLAAELAPGHPPMEVNTALGIALAGVALRLAVFDRRSWVLLGLRIVVSLAVFAIGALALAGDVLVVDTGVDRILWAGASDRMSALTATCMVLLGLSLAALDLWSRRKTHPASWLAIIVIGVAASVFVGHVFGMHEPVTLEPYTVMSWSTSVLLIILGTGAVMVRPESGPARSFLRDTPGGYMIRRLVPTSVGLAFLLGLLVDVGYGAGVYDPGLAMAVLLVAILAVLVALIWFHAAQVDRLDARAREASEERARLLVLEQGSRASAEAAERRFRDIVEGLSEIVWERDARTLRFIFVSERARRILGHPVQRWLEEPEFWERVILHPEDRDRVLARYRHPPAESVGNDIEYRAVAADGRVFWLRDTMRISVGEHGTLLRGISIDVTAVRRAEEKLRRARDQAEAESRAKDEFLAMLGHELRNPIGAISNSIRAIEVGRLAPEREQTLQRIVARQTRRLGRLVDDLLDVARLTRGSIELRREPTSLREIAAHACESFRANGVLRHQVVVEGDDVRVNGDPARLEQILGNLLDNAARYTPQDGRIEITIVRQGRDAVVRVADTGQGIEPEMLPRLFELFTRGRPPLRQAAGGLGIGLTLVKRLVELHEGTVEASSEGPGRGSVFTIRLPALSPVDLVQAEPVEPHAEMPTGSLRVLVVEDYEDARETLRTLLESRGHQVQTASTGPEGIEKILASPPDLAILDIGLAGMDGFEVARRIRESLGDHVLLVSLSGFGSLDTSHAPPGTFDGQLVKPLDPSVLWNLLDRLQKRKRPGSPPEAGGGPPATNPGRYPAAREEINGRGRSRP